MLDSVARKLIDPPLHKIATLISKSNLSGTKITFIGFGFGIIACLMAYNNLYILALIGLLLNRLCDGLDGAVARTNHQASDFGGYLDITLDFFIYAGFPFFMALGLNTAPDYMAASFVIFAMITTGVSFLAYAIMAAKHDMETSNQGKKSFYFSNGLMEGTETIIFLCLLCLLPIYFVNICFVFGILCFITTAMRIHMAYQVFK